MNEPTVVYPLLPRAFLPPAPEAIDLSEKQAIVVAILQEAKGRPLTELEITQSKVCFKIDLDDVYVAIEELAALGVIAVSTEILSLSDPRRPQKYSMLMQGTFLNDLD